MSDLVSQNPQSIFFSPRNEAMLDRLLYQDFQRRVGGDLSEKQKERLVRTVRHYMNEVYDKNGSKPIQFLNKEVLSAVVPDYLSYLRRQGGAVPSETVEEQKILQDVSARFGQLQTERQDPKAAPPAPPDFRIPLDDSPSNALSTFEQLKKQREAEAARAAELENQYMTSADSYKEQANSALRRDELLLAQRSEARMLAREDARNQGVPLPPDPRRFFVNGDSDDIASGSRPPLSGLAQVNPTLALPDAIRTRAPLPQDILKKQDDIITYRENEYNLFVYSGDRDWVSNSTENRYNFTINFDPANNRPSFSFSTAANIKFKNITRIEFIKAIVPTEGIDVLARQTSDISYNTDLNVNVLSFPYLMVRIKELDTNNFGTNNNIDNAFGVVQYDANWISDNSALNRGYLAMIPKFMKCQRVYYPTPLATLQKLSIQLQRPDGNLVAETLDTLDVSGFLLSSQLKANPNPSVVTGTRYVDTSGTYIWIQTTTFFSKFQVSQGDRIVFRNVAFSNSYTSNAGTNDFLAFIQRSIGHVVVDVGRFYKVSSTNYYATGANLQGYCNYVIIRNNFADPTTGSVSLALYGGSSASNTALNNSLPGARLATGRFLNLNHQTQFVLRVITRDMDSASRLRPDNM
jgi:hypothetical protein